MSLNLMSFFRIEPVDSKNDDQYLEYITDRCWLDPVRDKAVIEGLQDAQRKLDGMDGQENALDLGKLIKVHSYAAQKNISTQAIYKQIRKGKLETIVIDETIFIKL